MRSAEHLITHPLICATLSNELLDVGFPNVEHLVLDTYGIRSTFTLSLSGPITERFTRLKTLSILGESPATRDLLPHLWPLAYVSVKVDDIGPVIQGIVPEFISSSRDPLEEVDIRRSDLGEQNVIVRVRNTHGAVRLCEATRHVDMSYMMTRPTTCMERVTSLVLDLDKDFDRETTLVAPNLRSLVLLNDTAQTLVQTGSRWECAVLEHLLIGLEGTYARNGDFVPLEPEIVLDSLLPEVLGFSATRRLCRLETKNFAAGVSHPLVTEMVSEVRQGWISEPKIRSLSEG